MLELIVGLLLAALFLGSYALWYLLTQEDPDDDYEYW